jgi:hypothetical protein
VGLGSLGRRVGTRGCVRALLWSGGVFWVLPGAEAPGNGRAPRWGGERVFAPGGRGRGCVEFAGLCAAAGVVTWVGALSATAYFVRGSLGTVWVGTGGVG